MGNNRLSTNQVVVAGSFYFFVHCKVQSVQLHHSLQVLYRDCPHITLFTCYVKQLCIGGKPSQSGRTCIG